MRTRMRRRAKVLLAFLIVAASAALLLWNAGTAPAAPALGVSDAKRQAALLLGRDVSVRGVVVEGSIVEAEGRVVAFVLADAGEQLHVDYNQTPPDNFGPKEIVVSGRLEWTPDGVPVLTAQSIQVGCASKY